MEEKVDFRIIQGPLDIIGDVHGCFDELIELVTKLGYVAEAGVDGWTCRHPLKRKLVFVGDLVDRGPGVVDVLRFVMQTYEQGSCYCVVGNHDDKLKRALEGRAVKVTHGLEISLDLLASQTDSFKQEIIRFVEDLPSHLVFDGGNLVVAHAGISEELIGIDSKETRAYCLYGKSTGEHDEYGLPIRYPWASEYSGNARIVYGHTPNSEPRWENNTMNIDTGCVFGGKLTSLSYPELKLTAIKANKIYYHSPRSF